ncbi:hypothetical protein OHC33_009310 [Knufia fluminis]|uniref:Uncharacterized protein n=2 Tax=Knufia TaxID=430999 RepID=A0AAN8EA59_9EURO|nr:hypothetical protein OHC33_009310 [Knufia fluminis]
MIAPDDDTTFIPSTTNLGAGAIAGIAIAGAVIGILSMLIVLYIIRKRKAKKQNATEHAAKEPELQFEARDSNEPIIKAELSAYSTIQGCPQELDGDSDHTSKRPAPDPRTREFAKDAQNAPVELVGDVPKQPPAYDRLASEP